jgi:hypothetical protein
MRALIVTRIRARLSAPQKRISAGEPSLEPCFDIQLLNVYSQILLSP